MREVEEELRKKTRELGTEEQNRRVQERMRLCQEATLKDAEETRERDRKEAQRKLERMERIELGEDEEIAVVKDNDFVIRGPNQEELEAMGSKSWGGSAIDFKDVRIKDAQREFDASGAVRRVVMSTERVVGAEGGIKYTAEDKEEGEGSEDKGEGSGTGRDQEEEEEERCTSYEEDDDEEEEEKKKEAEKEKTREQEK